MWRSAAGARRLPAIPVCGSGVQCADPAIGVRIGPPVCRFRTPHAQSRARSPGGLHFYPRATKDDGKSAITTSRLPFLGDRARPVSRWARELPLTYLVHDLHETLSARDGPMGRGYGGPCCATRAIRHDAWFGFFHAASYGTKHGLVFFMRHRIRDRGFSPRPGRKGSVWLLTPLLRVNLVPDHFTESIWFLTTLLTPVGSQPGRCPL